VLFRVLFHGVVTAGEEVARLQLSQLQSELEALQQELMRSGAAATAAGGGSSRLAVAAAGGADRAGAGPLSLADALRELGQWQRRVQEVEAQLDEVRNMGRFTVGNSGGVVTARSSSATNTTLSSLLPWGFSQFRTKPAHDVLGTQIISISPE
jgi:hypothetical protein